MPTTLNIYGEMQEVNVYSGRATIRARIVRPGFSEATHQILWVQNGRCWADLSRELEVAAHEEINRLEEDGQHWVIYKRIWQTVPVGGQSQIPLMPQPERRTRRNPDAAWQDQAHAYISSIATSHLVNSPLDPASSGQAEYDVIMTNVRGNYDRIDEYAANLHSRERIRRMEDERRVRWLTMMSDPEPVYQFWAPTEGEDQ